MNDNTQAPVSPPRTTGHRLSLADPEAVSILRNHFATANFTVAGLRAALGPDFNEGVHSAEIPLVTRGLPEGSLLSTLIRLFVLGITAEPAALARDLKPLAPERLETLGLVRLAPGGVEPVVRFHPFAGLFLACDRRYADWTTTPADYVLEVNPSSLATASITSRRPVKSTLDVGAGCGIQSLLAAPHSERVVATDINPRALNFTAFNAMLNGFNNIECLEGSLLEPAAGRTFDLIICNPPYVISPDADLQFRDSGQPSDSFCRNLARMIPEHLNEGGFAAMLCNWALRKGETWQAPPTEWVAGSNCDVLLLHTDTQKALEYAGSWNRAISASQPRAYVAALDRWTDYYRRSGIEAIAAGGIVLRRRSGAANWVLAVDGALNRTSTCGDHVWRIIEAQDWMSGGRGDSDLLGATFRPAEDVRLEQHLAFRDGGMAPAEGWASLTGGFRFRAEIDQIAWHVFGLSDGRHRLEEIVERIGRESNAKIDEIRTLVLGVVRKMYATGFLTRV